MSKLHHTCNNCDSEFTIRYDQENCESDPVYCPFCAEYILIEPDNDSEDYE